MKLIIQIPCLNEEETLPLTLGDLPKQIPGIDVIETLVIDDGSSDRTVEVARKLGVNHILSLGRHRGLAKAFKAGLDAALRLGADIIVNTDADNQYWGEDIRKLVQPILEGSAQMVVGERPIDKIEDFSPLKKKLQRLGSWVVRQMSKTDIPDTTSGFRAYSREVALKINVFSEFTYTLETILQAGNRGINLSHVAVRTNQKLRESRLFCSTPTYIRKSLVTLARSYTMYQPLRVFSYLGAIVMGLGALLSLRFFYSFIVDPGVSRHIQSLIVAAVLFIIGFQIMVIGLLADIISANRLLLEDILFRVKKMELSDFNHREHRGE